MSDPFVSVIVPNYNYARYLDERFSSILNQTYQNFEIIVLDDHSTDNSIEIIEKYRDNPHFTQIVVNKENSGKVFSQWHKGFELAKGELIWIAESDDTCTPDLLERLVCEFQQDKKIVLAFSMTRLFRDDGWSFDIPSIDKKNVIRTEGKRFISRYMSEGCYITNASGALFRRNTALSLDKQFTTFRNVGDRMFWIELAEHGKVSIINEYLNFCRRHGSNVTEKNISTGVLQREDKQVMDYLVRKKLISRLRCLQASSRYVYGHIYKYNFDQSQLREELMKVWEVGLCRKIYLRLLDLKVFLSKIKTKI